MKKIKYALIVAAAAVCLVSLVTFIHRDEFFVTTPEGTFVVYLQERNSCESAPDATLHELCLNVKTYSGFLDGVTRQVEFKWTIEGENSLRNPERYVVEMGPTHYRIGVSQIANCDKSWAKTSCLQFADLERYAESLTPYAVWERDQPKKKKS